MTEFVKTCDELVPNRAFFRPSCCFEVAFNSFENSSMEFSSFGFLRFEEVSPVSLKLRNHYWNQGRNPKFLGKQKSQWLGMSYYVNFLEGLGSNEFHKKRRFGTHGS